MEERNYIKSLRKHIGHQTILVPGSRVIIENKKGEILLHKRTDFKDTWSLPGGAAEIGESFQDCILREVAEETGLQLINPKMITISDDPEFETVTYPNGDKVQLFVAVFWTNEWSGKLLKRTSESLDARFFNVNDLPKIPKNEYRSLALYYKHPFQELV